MNFKSNSSLHNTAFRKEEKILKWIHFSRCSQSFTKNLIGFIHTVDAGVHRYFVKLKEWMVQVDLKLSSVCRQHIQYTDWTIKWKWVIHATPPLRRDLVKISTRKLCHTLAQCLIWYYGYFLGYLLGSIQRFLPAAAWETLVSPNHTNENILRYRC